MSAGRKGIPGWVLPAGLILGIAGLVVVALMRGPTSFDPDTPEGVVQEYLQALDEERCEDALAVIQDESLGECGPQSVAQFVQTDFTAELGHNDAGGGFGGGFVERGVFTDEEQPFVPAAADATVDVTITHDAEVAGVIGGGWNEFVRFELLSDDGFWWIINDPWPYFTWNCRF